MKKADKLNVKYTVIVGEDEMAKGVVVLKDFVSRTQEELTVDQLVEKLK